MDISQYINFSEVVTLLNDLKGLLTGCIILGCFFFMSFLLYLLSKYMKQCYEKV